MKTDKKYNQEFLDWKEVIKSCIDQDRKAQEKLYKHFFPVMERMVLRYTQDDDQIIDILNNGFLKVFQKIDRYEGHGSFEGWIRKIIFRCLSDYFRKYKKDLSYLIYEDEFKKEPSESAQHQLYYQDLIALVNNLPEPQMKIFHLHSIEGYSHKEISHLLEINQNTCRWYLAEARKSLQAAYYKTHSNSYNEAG